MASIFWFLNAFNRSYTTSLHFPITFSYDTEGIVVVKPLPTRILLNVSGGGWEILKRTTTPGREPLLVTLPFPATTKYLTNTSLFTNLSSQLSMSSISLNYILTDTLFINIEREVSKRVLLRVDTSTLWIEKGYRVTSPISISPDSTEIKGPSSLVGAFPDIYTFPLDTSQRWSSDYEDILPIFGSLNELLVPRHRRIRVFFTVEKFERRQVSVPVERLNFPTWRSRRVVLSDTVVNIVFTARSKDVSMIKVEDFGVATDYKQRDRKEGTVIPELLRYPSEYVSELEMEPQVLRISYEKIPKRGTDRRDRRR